MKKMFAAAGIFFAVFFVILIFTTVGYYLFYNCSWLSAGASARLQSPLLFLDGVAGCLCFSILAALLGILIYFVQHHPPFFYQVSLWTVFVFAVFFIFIPCFSFFEKGLRDYVAAASDKKPVYVEQFPKTLFTPGFFRDIPTGTLYFTRVDDSVQSVSGLLLWHLSPGANTRGLELLQNDSTMYDQISSIPDPLIAQTLEMPEYIDPILTAVKTLMSSGSEPFSAPSNWFSAKAWKSYVLFLSMLPSVWILFAFTRFSSWKPLNMLLLPVLFLGVLYINFLTQCSDSFYQTVNSVLPLPDNKLLLSLLVNVLFFVLSGISGLVRMTLKGKRPGYQS